jgi:peptide/nickel transport system substrate-binding protein
MKARTIVLYVFVLAAMVLASCAGGATPSPVTTQAEPTKGEAQPTATTGEAAQPTDTAAAAKVTDTPAKPASSGGKVATLIFTQEFETLNPLYTNMFFSAITQQFWNCWAWDFDEKNTARPLLVKEMPTTDNGGLSADGKTITLKLHDGIVWSDGTPITSDDFAFTSQMYLDPKNSVATTYPYDKLDKIETPDKTTVVMTFKEPFAPWLFFWHGLLPAHVLKPVYDKDGTIDNADWNKAPTVGCGPYVFSEWERGSYAKFVANDKYWLGRPKIDQIFLKFVPDDAAQIAALKAGDGDVGIFISYPDIPTLESAGLKIVKVNSGYNEGLYFNMLDKGHPAIKDEKVRQAIAYAINRKDITDKLLLGKTQPAATFWDNTPYVDPSVQPYPYDPEKAKQLLDEAGWKDSNGDGTRDKDGKELSLRYGTTTKEVRQDTQAIVQQQLAEVGIKVELLNYESDTFFATYDKNGPTYTGQLDIMEWSDVPGAFPDPDTSYWLCNQIPSADNPQGVNGFICDKDLDALFQKQSTQVDLNQRTDTFHQISKYMFDKVYWLGMWQDPDQYALGKRLQNVKLSGVTPFSNVMEWDVTQ